MNYQEAFEALKNGDFKTAAPLLEKAARETGYASDIINHAYTLSLYKISDKARLADVAFRVGNSLLNEDPASAMDYFQRALFGGLDATRVRRIGSVFEGWAEPQAGVRPKPITPIKHVAHVVGCLLPGHAPTQYVKMLSAGLKDHGVRSTVFTTEWASSWFFNPQGIPQSQDVGIPSSDVVIASVEGDFNERASRVASAIRDSGAPVAFYHASLSEQITARVASLRPVPVQININHGSEMDADLFDGAVHLFNNAVERTRYRDRVSQWIPLASDIEDRLHLQEPAARSSLGFESASSVSATFGNLYKVAGEGYLRALVEIMKRFPKHFHVFAGAGDVKAMRGYLHSEGVLPRIRFMGHMGDVASLFEAVDVYLASFPHSGGHSVLEAMGAGKPVVVLGYPSDSHYNSGAELVGIPELIARNEPQYVEIADRVIRNVPARTQLSAAIRARFRAEFRPRALGAHYVEFLKRFSE